ncbi:alpha/beta hydrolase [Rhodococcus rhodnii]|uniref:Monoacylglycerol lipase n=2 Tax=Rhodococcus rhodnii TaxID=38312 RepID=R7WNY3_9NOCA|nr:alpha/beta hydrolase [Rhodococcus rhodnii]EOM77022.1 lysophospholipase [Rhodococcus rhodnii LMG 5362]TXG89904.1 alpha/beta hydrolase [Rhodococcus rhodnii]
MNRTEAAFTSTDATRIVYDVWTPDGPPRGVLVLCHGLGEHARRYDHVAARLGELDLVVYALDHRGHGRSGGKRMLLRDWSDYVRDVGALFSIAAREHPGAPRFLLGHSMGGAIALSYALDHQSELEALMLSGPAVDVTTGTPRPVREIGKVLGAIAPRVPVMKLDAAAVSRDAAVVTAYREDPLVHHGLVPAGIAAGLLRASESFPARLSELTLPVLVQHGSDDTLAPVSAAELIRDGAGSQDLTVLIYDGLYHEVFNEPEQETVLGDLVEWLRPRVPAAGQG